MISAYARGGGEGEAHQDIALRATIFDLLFALIDFLFLIVVLIARDRTHRLRLVRTTRMTLTIAHQTVAAERFDFLGQLALGTQLFGFGEREGAAPRCQSMQRPVKSATHRFMPSAVS